MEKRMVKSFSSMLAEVVGPEYDADWAVQNFAKSVATGAGLTSQYGGAMADASPLNLQNLDSTLTSVLFTEEHLELFGTLPRVPSLNLVYQFDRRLKYGGGRRAAGFAEGGSPKGGSSAWERDSATIRFMGVRRGITHQLMQVGNMGGTQLDPVAEENRNGTLELLEEIERFIYFGDGGVKSDNGQIVNYDGILKQMQTSPVASTNIIDLQGQPMSFENLEDAMQLFVENYYVTSMKNLKCLASPGIIADFSKLRYNIDRRLVTQGAVPGTYAGEPFLGYTSNFGTIPMKRHLFFQRVKGDAPVSSRDGADPGSPGTPVTVAAATATDATSNMLASTIYYSVSTFNDSGESLPLLAAATSAVAKGQRLDVTITQVTGATGYRVYRGTKADGSDAKWIADVPDSGAGTTVYADRNSKFPGTGTCLLWMNDPETIVIPQFMPLLRWPVAITTTEINWFLLLYHTLKVKAPQRVILFTNVGRLS